MARTTEEFGARVRALREKTGLSQERFADAIGVGRTHLGKIENGRANPTLQIVVRIALGLDHSLRSSLKPWTGGRPGPTPPPPLRASTPAQPSLRDFPIYISRTDEIPPGRDPVLHATDLSSRVIWFLATKKSRGMFSTGIFGLSTVPRAWLTQPISGTMPSNSYRECPLSIHPGAVMLVPTPFLRLLREDQVSFQVGGVIYEREGTELVSRGSVTLPTGGRWSAALEVRIQDDRGALLTVNRTGPGAGPAPSDASLVIPPGEANALLTLLTGLIAQAGADGVLERRPRDRSRRRTSSGTPPPDAPASTS